MMKRRVGTGKLIPAGLTIQNINPTYSPNMWSGTFDCMVSFSGTSNAEYEVEITQGSDLRNRIGADCSSSTTRTPVQTDDTTYTDNLTIATPNPCICYTCLSILQPPPFELSVTIDGVGVTALFPNISGSVTPVNEFMHINSSKTVHDLVNTTLRALKTTLDAAPTTEESMFFPNGIGLINIKGEVTWSAGRVSLEVKIGNQGDSDESIESIVTIPDIAVE